MPECGYGYGWDTGGDPRCCVCGRELPDWDGEWDEDVYCSEHDPGNEEAEDENAS